MRHLHRILTLFLSQNDANTVVTLTSHDVQMATDNTALAGIEVVLEPLVRPGGSLCGGLNAGCFNRVLTVSGTDQERPVKFLFSFIQHHGLTAKVLAL